MLEIPDEQRHANSKLAAYDSTFVRGAPRHTANLNTLLTDFVDCTDQLKVYVTKVFVISENKDYRLKSIAQIGSLTNGWEIVQTGGTDVLDAAKSYTDQQTTAIMRLAGNFDASTGNYPSTGTGTSGTIRRGDSYPVTVAGTVGGVNFDIGDLLYCLSAPPGQIAANWGVSEHNTSQSSEVTNGTAKIALQAEVQNENTLNDEKIVTPKKWWQALARFLAMDAAPTGFWTFVNGFRFGTGGLYATFNKSQTANGLTLKNNVYQSGAIGAAMQLNGSSQYGTFSGAGFPTGNQPFTIEFWIKTTSKATGIARFLAGFGNYNNNNGGLFGLTMFGGTLGYYCNGSNVNNGINISDGRYRKISCTYTGTVLRVKVDNVLFVTNSNFSANILAGNAAIGIYTGSSQQGAPPAASIDQLLIYNVSLTDAEQNSNWNGGFGTAAPVTRGLLSRHEFDFMNASVTPDDSGNGRNMTMFNNPFLNTLGKVPTGGAASEAIVFESVDGVTNGERGQQTFGDGQGGNIQRGKSFRTQINNLYPLWIDNFGRTQINPSFDGVVDGDGGVAGAYLHLGAGKATPNDAPFRLTPGVAVQSIPLDGAFNYDGTNLYFTAGVINKKLTDQTATTNVPALLNIIGPAPANSLPVYDLAIGNTYFFFMDATSTGNVQLIVQNGTIAVGMFVRFKNNSAYVMQISFANFLADGIGNYDLTANKTLTIYKTAANGFIIF